MKKFLLTITLLGLLFVSACSAAASDSKPSPTDTPARDTLTVFAAGSLTGAFTVIEERFEAEHPNTNVVVNIAGSQQLAQQLAQGAPADVFISANQKQMQTAIDAGRVEQDDASILLQNQLVIVYPADNPAGIRRLIDLACPGVSLVLGAEEVPVGGYSVEFLKKASQDPAFGSKYKENVLNNVVSYEQNVRAVLNKVLLGEADAGIVYVSDINKTESFDVGALPIPEPLNVNASYYIAPVSDSAQPAMAGEFISYMLSIEGQDLLMKYGFRIIG